MRYILSATIIALTIVYGAVNYTIAHYNQYANQPPAGRVALEKVKRALAYHGVLTAEQDEDGVLWFERKGEWCRLYTKAFEKSWKRRHK